MEDQNPKFEKRIRRQRMREKNRGMTNEHKPIAFQDIADIFEMKADGRPDEPVTVKLKRSSSATQTITSRVMENDRGMTTRFLKWADETGWKHDRSGYEWNDWEDRQLKLLLKHENTIKAGKHLRGPLLTRAQFGRLIGRSERAIEDEIKVLAPPPRPGLIELAERKAKEKAKQAAALLETAESILQPT